MRRLALLLLTALPACAEAPRRIAILGCHRQNEATPALSAYVKAKPEICLWIGDNVYADTKDDIGFIRKCYDVLAAKPGFAELKRDSLFLPTWDDHDFGLNDAGGSYALKAESKELFRKFWDMEDAIPAEQDGIYYSRVFGEGAKSLQIILLDPRYNREDPGPDADTLGEPQWKWLAGQLKQPAALRFIVSGYQILLDAGTGSETWAEFPAARERLFKTIRNSGAQGVLFLTGDQHYAEVCRIPGAIGYDAIELQFAGLNQIEEPEFNRTRVSPVATAKHKMGLIDIQWSDTPHDPPHLLFQVSDALTGREEIRYRVNFHELVNAKR